jgi:lipopolysaccharide transport system permease protein
MVSLDAMEQTPTTPQTSQEPLLILQASHGWSALQLIQVWRYRELLGFLIWRDIKVRYKQTVLGILWAVLQPVLTMVIFSAFFGGLAGVPSDGVPYYLFAYCGLVPWALFSGGLSRAATGLVGNANLIKKIYFPRLLIPISSVFGGALDFVLAFLVLIVLLLLAGFLPTGNVLWLPYFVLLALVTSLGVGLWLSAMNVQFRDVNYIIPFIIQSWLYITPIAYPSSLIENPLVRALYSLNPMVGVVEGFRWALLGTQIDLGLSALVSSLVAFFLLITGLFYFRRMERTFADVI